MSRIGKQIIVIPQGVDVVIDGSVLILKGPKGELRHAIAPSVNIEKQDEGLVITSNDVDRNDIWGLTRALIANKIKGVSEGFQKTLEFTGVGYKAQVKGVDLELNLGFSHPITIPAPEGITFKAEKNSIQITGTDKEKIGHVAANIRKLRPPEPYKGSGIRYAGEVIRRKAGKKAATAGA